MAAPEPQPNEEQPQSALEALLNHPRRLEDLTVLEQALKGQSPFKFLSPQAVALIASRADAKPAQPRRKVRRPRLAAQGPTASPLPYSSLPVKRPQVDHAKRTADGIDAMAAEIQALNAALTDGFNRLAQGQSELAEGRSSLRDRERKVARVEWALKGLGAFAAVTAIVTFLIKLL